MADIYVVQKSSDTFIGEHLEIGENGIRLLGARKVTGKNSFSVACLPPDDSDLNYLSPIVEELVIYRPDLLLKPLPSIADALRRVCGTGAIANEP